MKIKYQLNYIALGVFLFCFASFAFAEDYKCPEYISSKQKLISKVPAGWEAFEDSPDARLNLEYINVFDGHPKEMASLVPDNEGKNENPVWTFPKKKPRLIWIACAYYSTTSRIARSLPENITKCTLRYKPDNSTIIDSIRCQ